MLYDFWREVLSRHRNEIAVIEAASGTRHTFAELDQASAELSFSSGPVVFPVASCEDFFPRILAAWRDGKAVSPIEMGQPLPTLAEIPTGCRHIKFTSATTGPARAIGFTEAQLAADFKNIRSTMGLRPEWPNVAAISLAHSYGFSNIVLPLLLGGVPVIQCESNLPESVRQASRLAGAVTLSAVPALWRTWNEAGAVPENCQLAVSAGAPLGVELEADIFQKSGLKIHNFYGSSECGGIAFDRSSVPRTDFSVAGTALENVELAVREDGRLEVRGAAVGMGYLDGDTELLGAGRFVTNDIAEIRGGEVRLLGRASDVINIAGRKLLPETVEFHLAGIEGVAECLVFGAPSPEGHRNEHAVVCVVLKNGRSVAEIKAELSKRVEPWQMPREWHEVQSIQSGARGKISRTEWKRRHAAGELTD